MLVRRWVMSKAALGVETDLRRDLYGHLQALPVSFHDRWQSGQLLSRATDDLATVRRFLGFGLVFLVVNSARLRGRRGPAVLPVLAAGPAGARVRGAAGGDRPPVRAALLARVRGARRTSTAS